MYCAGIRVKIVGYASPLERLGKHTVVVVLNPRLSGEELPGLHVHMIRRARAVQLTVCLKRLKSCPQPVHVT